MQSRPLRLGLFVQSPLLSALGQAKLMGSYTWIADVFARLNKALVVETDLASMHEGRLD